MSEQALMSLVLERSKNKTLNNVLVVLGGVILISILAQLYIYLPWTPVPITGQTLGVTLVALSWGRWRGLATISTYLLLGALGLPVFAMGASGVSVGPTMGYLLGMLVSTFVVGSLADRGWTNSRTRCLMASFMGSLFVYFFGLLFLSHFVPKGSVFMLGLLPFLPGDILKNTLATLLSVKLKKSFI